MYTTYSECKINEFGNTLKPIDRITKKEINKEDIEIINDECFNINNTLKDIVPSTELKKIVKELENIKDKSITEDKKIEEVNKIEKKYNIFKKSLFLFLALGFIGISTYLINDVKHLELKSEVIEQNNKYIKGEILGQGGSATVYLATSPLLKSKNEIIIKEVLLTIGNKEIEILNYLKQFNNKYFPVILDSYIVNSNKIGIVMEYSKDFTSLSNIKTILKRDKKLFQTILLDILEGVEYLHSLNITHNDLKEDNIIVNLKTGEIKFIDFSSACIGECNRNVGRTIGYNIQDDTISNIKQDNYAIGKIIENILETSDKTYISNYLTKASEMTGTEPLPIDYLLNTDINTFISIFKYEPYYYNHNSYINLESKKIINNYYQYEEPYYNSNLVLDKAFIYKAFYQNENENFDVNIISYQKKNQILNDLYDSGINYAIIINGVPSKIIDYKSNINQYFYITQNLDGYLPINKDNITPKIFENILKQINTIHSKDFAIGKFDILVNDSEDIVFTNKKDIINSRTNQDFVNRNSLNILDVNLSEFSIMNDNLNIIKALDYYNYINLIYNKVVGKDIEPNFIINENEAVYNYLDDVNYFDKIEPFLTENMRFESIIDEYFRSTSLEKW